MGNQFIKTALIKIALSFALLTSANAYPIVAPECKSDPVQCAKDGHLDAVEVYGLIGHDDQKFFEDVDAAIPVEKPFPKVYLDSEGGSVPAGLAIGRILRKRKATVEGGSPFMPETVVECSSACSIIAAGATTRWLNHVGIHQGHYDRYKGPRNWHMDPVEPEKTDEQIRYFIEMGIEPQIADILRSTPPDQISEYFYDPAVSDDEQIIVQLGFHMSGTPLDTVIKMQDAEDQYYAAHYQRLVSAIDYGSNEAIFDMSMRILRSDHGEDPPYAIAVKWFEIGASRDDAESLHMLGYYALYGKGMKRDPQKSAEYYLRAAKLGFAGSQNNVGWAYYKGDGITRSIPDAVFWITRAADQGDSAAYGSLCEMHAAGDTFAKDDIEAYKWCRLAVDQETEGHARDNDIKLLKALIDKMSVDDIKKAQYLADQWAPLRQTIGKMGDVVGG